MLIKSETSSPIAVSDLPLPVVTPDSGTVAGLAPDQPSPAGVNTKIVDFGDSDVQLRIGSTHFLTHRYMLNKFAKLNEHVKSNKQAHPDCVPVIDLGHDPSWESHFQDTFKIVYALGFEGPFEFDTPILLSALRVSSAYDYPTLKTFCVSELEKVQITPIERLKIARECSIVEWEKQAHEEFCAQYEAISLDDARILGTDRLAQIAKIREERQRQKGQQRKEQCQREQLQKEQNAPKGSALAIASVRAMFAVKRVNKSLTHSTDFILLVLSCIFVLLLNVVPTFALLAVFLACCVLVFRSISAGLSLFFNKGPNV